MWTGMSMLVVGWRVVIMVTLVMMMRVPVGLAAAIFSVPLAPVLVSVLLVTVILLEVDVLPVRLRFVPAPSTCAPRPARVPWLTEGSPRTSIAVIVPVLVLGASSSTISRAGVSVLTAPAARYMLRVMRRPPARCAGSQEGGGGLAFRKRGAHCWCSASFGVCVR